MNGWTEFVSFEVSGGGAGANEPKSTADRLEKTPLSAAEEAAAIVRGWPSGD